MLPETSDKSTTFFKGESSSSNGGLVVNLYSDSNLNLKAGTLEKTYTQLHQFTTLNNNSNTINFIKSVNSHDNIDITGKYHLTEETDKVILKT